MMNRRWWMCEGKQLMRHSSRSSRHWIERLLAASRTSVSFMDMELVASNPPCENISKSHPMWQSFALVIEPREGME